jgi:hypothetical protein
VPESSGIHTSRSGNQCVITLKVQKPTRVTICFNWRRRPSADDREEWSLAVLGVGLELALEHSFRERAVAEALRKALAEGSIERVGVTPDGEWVFRGTGKVRSKPSSARPRTLRAVPTNEE